MPDNLDDAKGKTKKATGGLAGDKDLKREGQADKASGQAKKGIDKLKGLFTGRK